MEKITFEPLMQQHGEEVMRIFNYYIENSFAAYPEKQLPEEFFGRFLEMTEGYPSYALRWHEKIIGFGFLRAFHPFPVFRETAEISYFIDKEHTGKGLGKMMLKKLESEGKQMGIHIIMANISSENPQSIAFHTKNGFTECGRFPGVGKKFQKAFDMVWMVKKTQ
jgi:phosphinothricin acetyltransferase